jgi:hypothetical protein
LKSLSRENEKILEAIWESAKPLTMKEASEKIGLGLRPTNMRLINLRKAGFVSESGGGYTITAEGKTVIGFPRISDEESIRILHKTSPEKAFHFYAGIGQSLGLSADHLTEFCDRIRSVDVKSIEFHTARGDFESWIRHLGDIELEKRLRLVRETGLKGEALRERLYGALRSRCDALGRKTPEGHTRRTS